MTRRVNTCRLMLPLVCGVAVACGRTYPVGVSSGARDIDGGDIPSLTDADPSALDSGTLRDAQIGPDAPETGALSTVDASSDTGYQDRPGADVWTSADAWQTDAWQTDAGETDAGETDASAADASEIDASETDASVPPFVCSDTLFGGDTSACVQYCDSGVWCWGDPWTYQGESERLGPAEPWSRSWLFRDMAFGDAHGCGVHEDGGVWCWGSNLYGAVDGRWVANGASGDANVAGPRFIPEYQKASDVAAGTRYSCALTAGRVYCTNTSSLNPPGCSTVLCEPVAGVSDAIQIAGGSFHVCALLANGRAQCWGSNTSGQVGYGGSGYQTDGPVFVEGLDRIERIYAGGLHACAILESERVSCWGNNGRGQLGIDRTGPESCGEDNACSPVPVDVPAFAGARSLALGRLHTCVLFRDGRVACTGLNNHGQLGIGDTPLEECDVGAPCTDEPQSVALAGVEQIVAGNDFTCALLEDAAVRCWGTIGGLEQRTLSPSPVAGLDDP